jgi:hypothetical protein
MASEVDIVNLALSHIGDRANVSAINPPEQSMQAELAARFYPIARDTLLEMHTWSFSTRRDYLAQLTNTWDQWEYAYAYPQNVSKIIAVIPPEANDDYSSRFGLTNVYGISETHSPVVAAGHYVPQPFAVETDSTGARIIYTNQENAICRYTAIVTDTTKFSSLFTLTLSWHLASMLAGPIIKGEVGAAEAGRCTKMMVAYLSQAKMSDSDQRESKPEHIVGWVAGR